MKPCSFRILAGDALDVLRKINTESVQCVVTSPPYWGLRDYGIEGQLGLEATPQEYVDNMVQVFREVRRALRNDGTLWLNLGDSYAQGGRGDAGESSTLNGARHSQDESRKALAARGRAARSVPPGLKSKDLVGIPWRVAFALQADGWYLRADIIWAKPNAMPESVTDRPTKSHEYLFLLAKSERYFYDADAIREPLVWAGQNRNVFDEPQAPGQPAHKGLRRAGNKQRRLAAEGEHSRLETHLGSGVPWVDDGTGRNKRSVWSITTQPFPGAHFATFPEDLVRPCILAGSRPGDLVLDPFNGAGTTGVVAVKQGRDYVGIELNPEYVAMSERRIGDAAPLFTQRAEGA